jgi:small subunit ribosomal protein S15
MHSRKHGHAGSRKPSTKTPPSWVQLSKDEITDLVIKMAREGHDEATIGRLLRDGHGVPSVRNITGQTISQILTAAKVARTYPRDLMDLIKRAVGLHKHLKTNGTDIHNKSILRRTESKIKRLVKYYRGKKLPATWKYDPEQAALLVK